MWRHLLSGPQFCLLGRPPFCRCWPGRGRGLRRDVGLGGLLSLPDLGYRLEVHFLRHPLRSAFALDCALARAAVGTVCTGCAGSVRLAESSWWLLGVRAQSAASGGLFFIASSRMFSMLPRLKKSSLECTASISWKSMGLSGLGGGAVRSEKAVRSAFVSPVN